MGYQISLIPFSNGNLHDYGAQSDDGEPDSAKLSQWNKDQRGHNSRQRLTRVPAHLEDRLG